FLAPRARFGFIGLHAEAECDAVPGIYYRGGERDIDDVTFAEVLAQRLVQRLRHRATGPLGRCVSPSTQPRSARSRALKNGASRHTATALRRRSVSPALRRSRPCISTQ